MADQNDSSRSGTRSEFRAALLMVGIFGVIAAVFAVVAITFTLFDGDGDGTGDAEPDGPLRAAIVDQLDLTFPNQLFREEATATLEAAGYEVEYIPGELVTVDYYRELATHDYDLIVLRIHAARSLTTNDGQPLQLAELFTSERFSRDHAYELETGQVGSVVYEEGGDVYFGIGPLFVVDSMIGDFDGATIVMMGCNGLISEQMAEAFVRKGAGSFISWNDLVSVTHTDAATLNLLDQMLVNNLSSSDAAAATMAEVGPDPYYDSVLLSYPLED